MLSGYDELESYIGEDLMVKYHYGGFGRPLEMSFELDIDRVRMELGEAAERLRGNWWWTPTGDRFTINGLVSAIDSDNPEKLFTGSDEGLGKERTFSVRDLCLMERRQ
jgi:hypothetical protein